ncbi:MAG: polyketide synthase dehydratase domain-containing protein [Hyphomicrobiales bacterium]|nr:polyketide synthase dehydratase domain-containing protein [Hyphomicrobiales bacterium]
MPVRLPTYRWQRERFWFEPEADSRPGKHDRVTSLELAVSAHGHALRARRLATAHPAWEITLGRDDFDWLGTTHPDGEPVHASAALVALALASIGDGETISLRELEFTAPLTLTSGERTVQIIHTPEPGGPTRFHIYSSPASGAAGPDDWTQHATGWLERTNEARPTSTVDVEALVSRCEQDIPLDALAFESPKTTSTSTSTFRVAKLACGDGEAIATVQAARNDDGSSAFQVSVHALALTWQLMGVASDGNAPGRTAKLAPYAIDRILLNGPLPGRFIVHARASMAANAPSRTLSGDVRFFDAAGTIIAEMSGLRLEPASEAPQTRGNGLSRETLLGIPLDGRQQVVVAHFRAELARVLGIAESRIDDDQPLDTMGLDSLMAIQLQSRIEQGLGLRLSPMDLLLGPTLQELAAIVLERLPLLDDMQLDQVSRRSVQATGDATSTPGPEHANATPMLEEEVARLGQLSDEELDSLLNAMLAEEGNSK